jgi:hypothetical protein
MPLFGIKMVGIRKVMQFNARVALRLIRLNLKETPMSNKPKHTPGPWMAKLVELQKYKYWVIEERQYNGFQIASTINDEVEQGEANARLIAAAPELLAELKEAVRRMKEQGWITDLAEQVITKAEGNNND